jgi:NADH-quinone oxidoreductase subunit G
MGSVGACRQCAVRVFWGDDDETGEIAMSCMTPVREGLRAAIHDEEAVAFRRSIIELLMTNHPHDCPVCDEGGECHLQDMTVMTGHVYRRYRHRKRSWRNQDLGPFVTHEMNRCIQCYRCVRFYCDYAGGDDLAAQGLRDAVYFGRLEDGPLESEFSGNLVEVCPVGVFDDKILAARYTRKWDLQTTPSVCPHCARGCNVILGERYGELRRVLNRFNREVNGYFICDRGRYGHQFVEGERRVREVLTGARAGTADIGRVASSVGVAADADLSGAADAASVADAAVERLAALLRGGARVLGVGSPRASLEANYALRRLVGAERFHSGMADGERDLVALAVGLHRTAGLHSPSTTEIEQADAVVVLGEDLTATMPMLAFAIRRGLRLRPTEQEASLRIQRWNDAGVGQVKRQLPSVLWTATPAATKLDAIAAGALHAAPQDIARAALAVAHAVDKSAPRVTGLKGAAAAWAKAVARALKGAERPLVVAGVSSGSAEVLLAAARLAQALPRAVGLSLVLPEADSAGLALLGGAPLSEAFRAAAEGRVDALVVLENDLYRRASEAEVDESLAAVPFTLALDHSLTLTAVRADVVLPTATWAESTGTFVSHEGRAQRFYRALQPRGATRESWRWLAEVLEAAGAPAGWACSDDVLVSLAEELPQFAPALEAAPPVSWAVDGSKVPRQSARYSGRTAMSAPRRMVEPPPPADRDGPLAFTMEGFEGQPPPALLPRYWAPRWDSVQALNKFQEEVGGPLRGDEPGRLLFVPAEPEPAADGGSPGEPAAAGEPLAGLAVPPAFAPVPDEWLVVALHHALGGEELSALGPAIQQRTPVPYVALGEEDAVTLLGGADGGAGPDALGAAVPDAASVSGATIAVTGAAAGAVVRLEWGGYRRRLPLRVVPGLPRGVAGLPAGLPGLAGLLPPFRARLVVEAPPARPPRGGAS